MTISIKNFSSKTSTVCRKSFLALEPKNGTTFRIKRGSTVILSFKFDGKYWIDSCGNDWTSEEVGTDIRDVLSDLEARHQDLLQHA